MKRGTDLLLAQLASFDEPARPPAQERLAEALGEDLARRLVSALSAGAPQRAEPLVELDARAAVVAA